MTQNLTPLQMIEHLRRRVESPTHVISAEMAAAMVRVIERIMAVNGLLEEERNQAQADAARMRELRERQWVSCEHYVYTSRQCKGKIASQLCDGLCCIHCLKLGECPAFCDKFNGFNWQPLPPLSEPPKEGGTPNGN